jgi:4-diphosphocytidyl-2-C-methyl-D-erythritol kinase
MTFFPLADRLEFFPYAAITVESLPQVTELGEDNLVWRAVVALQQRTGRRGMGIRIRLHKHLPVAAGLGGGSSDAATTLLALNQFWQLGLGHAELQEVAITLGADVPFFIGGHTALVEGIGERLTPLPEWPRVALVLVNPGVPLTTHSVFRAFAGRLTRGAEEGYLERIRQTVDPATLLENDLEPIAQALEPKIGVVTQTLRLAGARATLMSGSGPSVFGLFADLAKAEAVAHRLRQEQPSWRILAGLTNNLHPFAAEWAAEAG